MLNGTLEKAAPAVCLPVRNSRMVVTVLKGICVDEAKHAFAHDISARLSQVPAYASNLWLAPQSRTVAGDR